MKPRNFPDLTPKAHFKGLSFIWNFLKTLTIYLRCSVWSPAILDLISMSSTYTSIVFLIRSLNLISQAFDRSLLRS